MLGRNLYESRRRMGMALAAEAPVEADMVMPVPDTGAPAAAGFAEGIRAAVSRGHGPQPLFRPNLHPAEPAMRQRGVTVKLSPLREVVAGKRLIVVDDSIVRGTTTRQIVALLRKAGATEVHLRISSPPIHHPCFYGIDTQIETELIASTHSVEEIREFVGADSLSYLSIGGVLSGLDLPYDKFCFACFDGRYPVPVPYDTARHKFVLEDVEPRRRAGLAGRGPRRSRQRTRQRTRREQPVSEPASGQVGRRLGRLPRRRRGHRRRREGRGVDARLGGGHAAAGGDRRAGRIRFCDGAAGGHARAGPGQFHGRRRHEDRDRDGSGPVRHGRPGPGGDVRRRPGLRRGGAALLPRLRGRGPDLSRSAWRRWWPRSPTAARWPAAR
jgi:hypothetical protein